MLLLLQLLLLLSPPLRNRRWSGSRLVWQRARIFSAALASWKRKARLRTAASEQEEEEEEKDKEDEERGSPALGSPAADAR